jgi:hypothetical protein
MSLARLRHVAVLLLILPVLVIAVRLLDGRCVARAGTGGTITLDDVFAEGEFLDELMNRALEDFQVAGPPVENRGDHLYIEKSFRGMRTWGYPRGVNPNDPGAELQEVEDRITLELWVPSAPNFANPNSAYLFLDRHSLDTGAEDDPDVIDLRLKRVISRKMALRGIPSGIIFEQDRHPIGAPVPQIYSQLGYAGNGKLEEAGFNWIMANDPVETPLTVRELRYAIRFQLSQMYILSATFLQKFLLDHFGPQSAPWLDALKTVYAGGSKWADAVITAAGVDPRVVGLRIQGNQGYDDGPAGGAHRYESDWRECPGGGHRWAPFSKWAYDHRDDLPSYMGVYYIGRDDARYAHLKILDVVGTHDWVSPLGATISFWRQRDGLVGGQVDPNEPRWNTWMVRRINVNHGLKHLVGREGNFDIGAEDLLAWRLMRHLALGGDLPRFQFVTVNTVTNPSSWVAKVHVNGAHAPSAESYKVYVALSDDRDFTRCGPPVFAAANTPCVDGAWGDDNKEAEDRFVTITPTSVNVNGEFRFVRFAPPAAELAAIGTPTPLIAVIVELKVSGPNPNTLADDIWLHTDVWFVNESHYPPYECPP